VNYSLAEFRLELYRLEERIATTKKELDELEFDAESIKSQCYSVIADTRFKNKAEFDYAFIAECHKNEEYTKLAKSIRDHRHELDSARAKHALRRREYRELEAENAVSGLTNMQVHDYYTEI
jgi:hypothetical protein